MPKKNIKPAKRSKKEQLLRCILKAVKLTRETKQNNFVFVKLQHAYMAVK